jgi:hypothetical protein
MADTALLPLTTIDQGEFALRNAPGARPIAAQERILNPSQCRQFSKKLQ